MNLDQEKVYDHLCEDYRTVTTERLMRHDTYSQMEEFRVAIEEAGEDLGIYLDDDEKEELVEELANNFLKF